METVFVLFSANLSQNCLVAHNEMSASELLPRSYGVWVASNAQASVAYNKVRNLKYGVCLAAEAAGLVCFNEFSAYASASTGMETFGIIAQSAKELVETGNAFEGLHVPIVLPENRAKRKTEER